MFAGVDKGSGKMVCIINPTILKSERNELVLKIDGRNITLDLSKCATNWSKKANVKASKCVATRNIIEKSFVFQTEPQTKLIFKNCLWKGDFLKNSAKQRFVDLQKTIESAGFTSYDLG